MRIYRVVWNIETTVKNKNPKSIFDQLFKSSQLIVF